MMAPGDHDEDEALISGCSVISKAELVFVSMVKRTLADEVPANFRLKFLEWLDSRSRPDSEWKYLRITSDVIAAIRPTCDRAHGELWSEIRKLGKFDRINAVGRDDVFRAFVAFNPSLLTAIRMARGRERQPA